jgi:peptidoglycan/xylan/chitin deacetylase (PgdA/CDA1 family)
MTVKSGLKRMAASLLSPARVRRTSGGILMLHRVRRTGPSHFGTRDASISPESFGRLLDALTSHGYVFRTLDQTVDMLSNPGPRTGPPIVCLTFDDGYLDNLEHALRITRARAVPVTIFVTTGFIDRAARLWWLVLERVLYHHNEVVLQVGSRELRLRAASATQKKQAYDAALRHLMVVSPLAVERAFEGLEERLGENARAIADQEMLTWEMLRRLSASPDVEIGAHTVTHPRLSQLNRRRAWVEIEISKHRLETELGRTLRHFAYPFGDCESAGEREAAMCAEIGFVSACTARHAALPISGAVDLYRLPRVPVGHDDEPAAVLLRLAGLSRAAWRRS